MGWRGFLTGALGLVFLETIVQPAASKRVDSGIGVLVGLVRKFLDPAVPAISAAPKSSSDSGSGGIFGDILGLVPKGPITGIPLLPVSYTSPAAGSSSSSSSPYSLIPKPSTGGSATVLA